MKQLTLCLAITFSVLHAAHADVPERFAGRIAISAVSASVGNIGESSRLRLTIRNDNDTRYQFLGVDSLVALDSAVMGRIDKTRAIEFGSLPVLPDETLDFNTSHLAITLSLRQPLVAGKQFPLTPRFAQGSVAVTAHVHP